MGLSRKGQPSPWGTIDHVSPIAPGLQWVSTPGHGGIEVDTDRQRAIKRALPRFVTFGGNGPRWYEEDCDATAVILTFPELFKPGLVRSAVGMAGCRGKYYGLTVEQIPAKARQIGDAWKAENAELWEPCGGSGGGKRGPGWWSNMRRVGDGAHREAWFEHYPEPRLYTTAELDEREALAPTA